MYTELVCTVKLLIQFPIKFKWLWKGARELLSLWTAISWPIATDRMDNNTQAVLDCLHLGSYTSIFFYNIISFCSFGQSCPFCKQSEVGIQEQLHTDAATWVSIVATDLGVTPSLWQRAVKCALLKYCSHKIQSLLFPDFWSPQKLFRNVPMQPE